MDWMHPEGETKETARLPKPSLVRSSSLLSYKKFLREKKNEFDNSPSSSSHSTDTSGNSDSLLYTGGDNASFHLLSMEEENNDVSLRRDYTSDFVASIQASGFCHGEPEIFQDSVADSDYELKNRQLSRVNKMLRDENSGFAAQLVQMQRTLKIAEQQRLLADEQLARALTQYHALGERLQRMEENWRERGEGQKLLEQELEQAQQAVDAKEDALKNAQREFERLQTDIQSLGEEREELTEAVESRLVTLENAMVDLQLQYDDAVNQYNLLCDAVDNANHVVEETREELQASRAHIVRLENELSNKDAELSDLRAQLDEAGRNPDALLNLSFYRPGTTIKSPSGKADGFSRCLKADGNETDLRRRCFTDYNAGKNFSTRSYDFGGSLAPLPRLRFDNIDDSTELVAESKGNALPINETTALCRGINDADYTTINLNQTFDVIDSYIPPVQSFTEANIPVLPLSSSKTLHDELLEIEQHHDKIFEAAPVSNVTIDEATSVIKVLQPSPKVSSEYIDDNTSLHSEPASKKSSLRKALRFGRYAAIFGVCIAYHYSVLLLSSGGLFDSISVSHSGNESPAW